MQAAHTMLLHATHYWPAEAVLLLEGPFHTLNRDLHNPKIMHVNQYFAHLM